MSGHAAASRPTLLVFTLGPDADCRRRPVLPPRLRAMERRLRAETTARALEAGRVNGCGLEISSPSEPATSSARHVAQHGDSFGERLISTLAASWRRNPDGPVVVVGGDVPGLAPRHVAQALEQVRRDRDAVIVGPSPDGGFYLLASRRPLDEALGRVRWCRSATCSDLVSALRRRGRRVVLLEPLGDLDRPSDLATLLASDWSGGAARWLAGRLRAALRELSRPLALQAVHVPRSRHLRSAPRRGPPA